MRSKVVSMIINKVNEELENPTPSAYRVYIFLMKDNNRALFNARYIDNETFNYMKNEGIIEYCGETKHQEEECLKYKFTHAEYPKKILFDHKTKINSLWCIAYNENTGAFHLLKSEVVGKLGQQWDIIADQQDSLVSHSFVHWSSKKNDLSNQPDKPWDYVGKKPKLSTILKDWDLFINAYESIIERS